MPYVGPQPVPLANERLTPGKIAAGEQVFVVPRGYAVGHIHVFLNGAFLPPDQYTATDGSTVDLGEPMPSQADILVLEQKTFARADHYDKGAADARFARLEAANDFTQMPTVGGAPIVESGSNSDGDWTKFADGTLHCTRTSAFASPGGALMPYTTWTLPRPFLEGTIPAVAISAGTSAGSGYRCTGQWVYGSPANTNADYRYEFGAAIETTRTVQERAFATGRWK